MENIYCDRTGVKKKEKTVNSVIVNRSVLRLDCAPFHELLQHSFKDLFHSKLLKEHYLNNNIFM